jgi:hypothetical protein
MQQIDGSAGVDDEGAGVPERSGKLEGCRVPEVLCPQAVIATALANACDGVIQWRVCRGRVLSERAMASSSRWVHCDRSADLGRYWRSSPLVFSLLPRCQGLLGSQKEICTPVSIVNWVCSAICLPWSEVIERRSCASARV